MDTPKSSSPKISRSLITFAFVRECFEATGDLVLGMVPLFAPAIKLRAGNVFDPHQFSDDLAEMFGLKMNPLAAEDLAPRLEKAGLLINRAPAESSTQYINSNPEIPTNQQTANKVDRALTRIIDFVQTRLRAANIFISDERVEDEFFIRVSQNEFLSLFATKDLPQSKHEEKPLDAKEIKIQSILDFLIARAVIHMHDQHAEDAATVEEIFGGFLVSEIVAGLQKPPDRGARTKYLIAYLDTPVVLPYLGFSSRARSELVEQLLGDVRQMGIGLAVFDHTVAEMHRVIKASLETSHICEAIGDVSIRILQDQDAKVRARMYVSNPRDQLRKMGLTVVDFGQKFNDTYKFFFARA